MERQNLLDFDYESNGEEVMFPSHQTAPHEKPFNESCLYDNSHELFDQQERQQVGNADGQVCLPDFELDKTKENHVSFGANISVVQANELIRSKQDELTLLEAKLIKFAVAQIVEWEPDRRTFKVPVMQLVNYLGMDKANVYRDLDSLTTSVMKKMVYIKSKEPDKFGKYGYKKFQWITWASYQNGIIEMTINEALSPYLNGLQQLFTRYLYSDIIKLPTYHSIRLYELLSSYWNMKFSRYPINRTFDDIEIEKDEVYFRIDQLKNFLNLENKYANNGDFIIHVIEPSVKAIRKHTMMRPVVRKVKKGRSIIGLVFKYE